MYLSAKKILFVSLSVFLGAFAYSQDAVDLKNVFNPDRIREGGYKLVMYNQNKDTVSNMSILDRQITREKTSSGFSIKIVETSTQGNTRDKTTVYVNARTLAPQSFEFSQNDTLTQKATFDNGKVFISDYKNGSEKKSEVEISPSIFLSNCFSELVQANDFVKNPVVKYSTFAPGRTPGEFVAEKNGEKEFTLANGEKVDCWIIKFTRTDSKGNTSNAGYRYIDKVSGKVLLFKTNIDTDSFFTYQTIFLH